MKTFLLNIPQRLKLKSQELDASAALCDKPWTVFNDEGIKQLFIFQPDGTLLITTSSIVSSSTWRYISANKSIIITTDNKSIMFHPAFLDDVVFALQQDGEGSCLFMIDENNKQSFSPRTLRELTAYFTEKERLLAETEHREAEEEKLRIDASLKKNEERLKRERREEKKRQRKRRLLLFLSLASGILLLLLLWSLFREPRVYTGKINEHEWVDLGLSVKWATCNVGASAPFNLGDFFAWGETSTKDRFEDKNYRFFISRGDPSKVEGNIKFSKYVCDHLSHGVIDNLRRLVLQDDAANANWGGTWRMATDKEWAELKKHCRWMWIEQSDKVGYEIVSKRNGNSIFLPVSRWPDSSFFGFYWSSSLRTDFSSDSWGLRLYPESVDVVAHYRGGGGSIRPVTK